MWASEFDDSGYFRSLKQAERDVERRWKGVDIFGPDEIIPPFERQKAVVKTKTVTTKTVKKQSGKKRGASKVRNKKFTK